MKRLVFINRRRRGERRYSADPGHDHPFDLSPQKRRKSRERRDITRSLSDDYYAYMQKTIDSIHSRLQSKRSKPQKT